MPKQSEDSEAKEPAEEPETVAEQLSAEDAESVESPTTCVKCGAEMPEAARFCASCGNVVDPNAIAANARKKRTAIIAGAVALVLVLAAGVGGVVVVRQQQAAKAASEAAAAKKAADKLAAEKAAAKHAEQADELRAVFNKVAAIDSAVSVGTNERDYTSKVQDARAVIDAYNPPDSQTQSVITKLEGAMTLYSSASSYWNAAIIDSYSSPDEDLLATGWQSAGTVVEAARAMVDSYENSEPESTVTY